MAVHSGPAAEDGDAVNPHYVGHLVSTASAHEIEVTEDIVNERGVKLLARGAKVDARLRERLLAQKLQQPLENCLGVAGGVGADQLRDAVRQLLQRHPLLAALAENGRARPIELSLSTLALSAPMRSLLTVYAGRGAGRLAHAAGVALVAVALARRLRPDEPALQRRLGAAGLLHDVGELYLDPALLVREGPLGREQWRFIASHPIVAQRVLGTLPGAGKAIADLVLSHHERLDGFGYPRGLEGRDFSLAAQMLALAEWVMGLVEAHEFPVLHGSVAARLIHGEFAAELLQAYFDALRLCPQPDLALADAPGLHDALARVLRSSELLTRFAQLRPRLDAELDGASPQMRHLVQLCVRRMTQLQTMFSSAGLDAQQPRELIERVSADDSRVRREMAALLREFDWRANELHREAELRAGVLGAPERERIARYIDEVTGGVIVHFPAR